MTVNTVIFDLDGTLLNTLEDLTDSVNYALNKYGYPLKSTEEIKNSIGNGVHILIKKVIPDGISNPNFCDCLSSFKEHYSKNSFNKTKPYEGISELLTHLKSNGYKTAVVSNKFDSAVKELCNYYFKNLIDYASGQSENIPPKPDSKNIFNVISKLKVKPKDCILIGDSEVDIQTAQNAGIPCISVSWGYKSIDFLYKQGATTLIYSPFELLELI